MKPVKISSLRPPNAKEKASSSSVKLETFPDGNLSIETTLPNRMSAKDIFSILCFSVEESSTCVSMLFALHTTLSLFIYTEQVLLDLLMKDTTMETSTIYVLLFHNVDKHLTNVAININSPNYVKWIGGKWFLEELKKFMLSKLGV